MHLDPLLPPMVGVIAVILILGSNWQDSLYSGALLAQIGEFSFVLASVGLQANIIQGYAYQMTIAVIAIRLLLSPSWIFLIKWLFKLPR